MSGLCQSHETPQASPETLLLRPPAAGYLTLGAGRAAPRRRGPVPTSALLKGACRSLALGLWRGPSAHGQQFPRRFSVDCTVKTTETPSSRWGRSVLDTLVPLGVLRLGHPRPVRGAPSWISFCLVVTSVCLLCRLAIAWYTFYFLCFAIV